MKDNKGQNPSQNLLSSACPIRPHGLCQSTRQDLTGISLTNTGSGRMFPGGGGGTWCPQQDSAATTPRPTGPVFLPVTQNLPGCWNIQKPLGLPAGPVVKNLPADAGDTGSIPGPGRFHTPWDG